MADRVGFCGRRRCPRGRLAALARLADAARRRGGADDLRRRDDGGERGSAWTSRVDRPCAEADEHFCRTSSSLCRAGGGEESESARHRISAKLRLAGHEAKGDLTSRQSAHLQHAYYQYSTPELARLSPYLPRAREAVVESTRFLASPSLAVALSSLALSRHGALACYQEEPAGARA